MKKRNILLWMLFFTLVCNTLVTLSINVAIISMVRTLHETIFDFNNTKMIACPNTTVFWDRTNEEIIIVNVNDDRFDWSDYEKRSVLSAYHWLSFLSVLPGSVLAQKFGSKTIMGYSIFISAVMSSIIPYVAQYGAKMVAYVRMVQGFISFVGVPGAISTIIGNWSSEGDRGIFFAMFLAGSSLTVGAGSFLFGYIGQYLHWQYIFHLTSLCGIVWIVFWYFLVYDYPDRHPTISANEKSKLLKSIKYDGTSEKIPIPWKNIFTSVPVIVCGFLNMATLCNFFILITFMPLYLNDTYGLNSNQSGIIVCLPQFIFGIFGVGVGRFIDFVTKKRWLSLTNTRKLFGAAGCIMASTMLIIMAFTKCNLTVIVICYTVCTFSRNIDGFGLESVMVDLSPKFCGIIHGLVGTATELMALGILAGMSHLTKLLPREEFWKIVFLVTASIGIGMSVSFLIWGSAETQPWNQGSKKTVQRRNTFHRVHVPKSAESEA